MKIRKASLTDKQKISELYYELYPERKSKNLVPIEKSGFKTILLVAEESKQVAGFIWTNFIAYGFSKFGYIEELFVNKKFRGKGIGEGLVKEAVKQLNKLKAQVIFVSATTKAVKFYKKLGFKMCKGPWLYLSHKK